MLQLQLVGPLAFDTTATSLHIVLQVYSAQIITLGDQQ